MHLPLNGALDASHVLAGLHRQDSSDTLLLAFYALCVLSIQVVVMDKNTLKSDTTLGTAQIEVSNAVGSP